MKSFSTFVLVLLVVAVVALAPRRVANEEGSPLMASGGLKTSFESPTCEPGPDASLSPSLSAGF